MELKALVVEKVPVKTDTDSNNAIDKLRDATAEDRTYARIAAPPKDLVVTYKTCIEELGSWYNDKSDEFYFTSTRDEVMELKYHPRRRLRTWSKSLR